LALDLDHDVRVWVWAVVSSANAASYRCRWPAIACAEHVSHMPRCELPISLAGCELIGVYLFRQQEPAEDESG
jgi:hypothetical protein